MLFEKKHRKKIQIAWTILSLLIAISMVILYMPGLYR